MSHAKRDDLTDNPTYLSLGSNLGPRESTILHAVRSIDSDFLRVTRVSSLYESAAFGCGSMRDFVNAVVQVQSLLCGEDLLNRLKALERRFGRRGGHNEPRTLDIDIVAMGTMVTSTETLTLPHPGYRDRLFVLAPLREIAPGYRCPLTGEDIDSMVTSVVGSQNVTRISSRWLLSATSDRLQYVYSDQK